MYYRLYLEKLERQAEGHIQVQGILISLGSIAMF